MWCLQRGADTSDSDASSSEDEVEREKEKVEERVEMVDASDGYSEATKREEEKKEEEKKVAEETMVVDTVEEVVEEEKKEETQDVDMEAESAARGLEEQLVSERVCEGRRVLSS